MGTILHNTIRAIPYTLWFGALVAFGSVIGDADHILPPFTRSWGHSYYTVVAVFIGGISLTYLCRLYRARILR